MKNLFWMVALVAIFLATASCRRDDRIGFNLIAQDQIFSGTDTVFQIETSVIDFDTLRTDNLPTGQAVLGKVFDPIFGETSAEMVLQFNLGLSNDFRVRDSIEISENEYRYFYHEFGVNAKADSLVLFLPYDTAAFASNNLLGDPNVKQQIDVRLLKDTLAIENFNTTEISPLLSNESLGTIEHSFTPDSLRFRFKVTNQEFVDTFLNNNTEAFESPSRVIERKFKGIALLNNTNDPSFICRFNLASSQTRLRMYYTNDSLADKDTVVHYDFLIDAASIDRSLVYTRYFTRIEHDFSGSEIEPMIESNTTDNGKVYIQSLMGARSVLKFSGIKNWLQENNYQIRFAHLVLRPVDEDINDQFPALDQIEIYELDEDKQLGFVAEYLTRGNTGNLVYSGEDYDPVDNEYRYDITSYVKKLRDNPEIEENGLILSAQNRNYGMGRTVFHSANSNLQDLRMFVKITYSRIE